MCIGDNIMKNRLKDMRLKRGISQKILGIEIGYLNRILVNMKMILQVFLLMF